MEPDHRRLQLSPEAAVRLQEGINLLLSRWSALQVAVENEFGGRNSRQRSQQLSLDIFSWFTQSKEPIYVDDLEDKLDEFMLSLNTEIDDGSIEEISEKLMILHEECLDGNFTSIERLKDAPKLPVSHSIQASNDDEDSDEESDAENSREDDPVMVIDAPNTRPTDDRNDMIMMVDEPSHDKANQAEDGWTVVSSRRSKGRRN